MLILFIGGPGDRFDRRDSYKRQSTGYGSVTCTEVGTNYYPCIIKQILLSNI